MRTLKVLTFLVLVALLPAVANADTLLTSKSHTDGFSIMGQKQEAEDSTLQTWIGKDRMAQLGGPADIILRFDQSKMYVVEHNDKTFSPIDLPVDLKKLVPAEMAQMMEQMAAMMKVDFTVTPGNETKQVGQWNAKKYLIAVNMMGMKMDIESWHSNDVAVDYEAIKRLAANKAALQTQGGEWIKKVSEIEGYPVLQKTTTTFMGTPMKSTQELVSVEEKTAPAGTYDVPGGYKEKQFNPMEQGQRRR